MQSNQTEVQAVANVKPGVSAITLAYGVRSENAQMLFAVSMALETLPAVSAEKSTFQWSKYNAMIESESGFSIAKKTIQNNATLARALQDKFALKLAELGEHSETSVHGFADFLRETVANTTYTLKRDDLIALCKGELSDADKRKQAAEQAAATRAALEEAKRKQAADAAAAKEQAAQAPAQAPAAPMQSAEEREAAQAAAAAAEQAAAAAAEQQKQAAAKLAAEQAETARIAALTLQAERDALAQAQEAAAKAQAQAETYEVRAGILDDGSLNVIYAPNVSPEFLEKLAAELKRTAKAKRQIQQSAMGSAMDKALKAA